MQNKTLLLFIGVLIIGAFFRFYLIQEIPPGLYPDEATNGNNAVEALSTGAFKVFYPENNGREGLFINLQAIAIRALGTEPWVLRLVSAIFGTLTIAGLWLLARELSLSPLLPFFSSFFLAASYWHINFSRIGFRAIMVPFFSVFTMYLLLRALRKGGILESVGAGILLGLGLNTYIASRFLPFVVAVPRLFFLWVWWKASAVASFCAPCLIALFLLGAIVASLPLGLYFIEHPGDFLGRGGQVSIFAGENPVYEFAKSNALTLQMFFWKGDCNQRHNFNCEPELHWPVAVFFLIGSALAIRGVVKFLKNRGMPKNDQAASLMILAWFFFMLFPATLTREGLPHALRSIGLIPPVFLLAGWGATYLWEKIKSYLDGACEDPQWVERRAQINRIKKEFAVLMALLLIFIGVHAYRAYFVRFAHSIDTQNAFAADLVQIGRYINALPRETKKIVVVDTQDVIIRGVPAPAQTPMFISDTFGEEKRAAKNVTYVKSMDEIQLPPKDKVAVIPINTNPLKELKKRFPGLRVKLQDGFVSLEN